MKLSTLMLVSVFGAILATTGCNLFGDADHATTREELIEEAKAALDEGDCDRALAAASAAGGYDDEVLKVKGWAELCSAGVTVNKVGATLFNYNASDPDNYDMLGQLANAVVPSDDNKLTHVEHAIEYFGGLQDTDLRGTNLTVAQLSKAAVIIAKRSSDSAKVRRADIYSSSTCIGATCTAPPAGCNAGMSDADANAAADAFDAAATAANTVTSLGRFRDFARQLGINTGLPSVTRCVIVNNMLTE